MGNQPSWTGIVRCGASDTRLAWDVVEHSDLRAASVSLSILTTHASPLAANQLKMLERKVLQLIDAEKSAVIRAIGGRETKGVDVYVAATKVFLAQSLVVNATARFTKANQFGLLGFGGDAGHHRSVQFEGSAGKLITRSLLVGAEYRTKPDNLGFAKEDDSYDLFAAWAVHRNVTVTAAYVDLGDIATVKSQRGLFLSLQGGF